MLSEKLELYIESYFRPYKKDKAYNEKKKELLKMLENLLFQLKNNGIEDREIYNVIIKELESGNLGIDVNSLTIDENNKVEYFKKIFVNNNLEDLPFINVKYRLCDFKGSTIQNLNIAFSEFNGCYLKRLNVINSTVSESTFKKSDFNQSNFENCKINNSSFNDTHMPNVSFADSLLLNVSFENCYLKKVSFANSKLINVNFKSCTISKIDFMGATMDRVTYRFLKEESANLNDVKLIN